MHAKRRIVVTCAFFAVAGCVALGMLQQPAPEDDLGVFVERLLLEHKYLLPAAMRPELDELHRELRILETPRNAPRVARQRSAREKVRAASARVLESMEQKFLDVSLSGPQARVDSASPIEVPGDIGALLLRVNAQMGNPRYVVRDYDFSERNAPIPQAGSRTAIPLDVGSRNAIALDVGSRSASWILVDLKNVPPGRTAVTIQFRTEASRTLALPVQIRSPDTGRLKVRIQSAGTGEVLPAMVNLVRKISGKARMPAGAVELADQFDSRGSPTGRRHTNLPGELEGRFWWIVPKPFDMELFPGAWAITVRKGLEYVPESRPVMIESGKTTEVVIGLSRWADMAGLGWYSGDDHVHCRIQSDADAENLSLWLRAEDLKLANVVEMGDLFRTYFQQRGFGPAYRYQQQGHILSPGQECPRTGQFGHTLSMNTTSMVRFPDQYFLYDLVFDKVHRQGGLSGYAHADTGASSLYRDMSLNVTRGKIDFFEILQFGGLGTKLYYDFLNLGFKLVASAGSDVPFGGTVGEARVYVHLGKADFSAERWFDAFRKGRTFVTDGPILDFRVESAFPGDEIKIDRPGRELRVVAKVRRDRRLGSPSLLQVFSQGDVVREIRSDDPVKEELELSFLVKGGDGFWIAARAEARDGTYAHTTPVYVARGDLRFWRHAQVPEMIQEHLRSLETVERMASVAERIGKEEPGRPVEDPDAARAALGGIVNRRGEVGDPYMLHQLALQGPELRERVKQVRKIYDEMLGTWRKEASLRQPPGR